MPYLSPQLTIIGEVTIAHYFFGVIVALNINWLPALIHWLPPRSFQPINISAQQPYARVDQLQTQFTYLFANQKIIPSSITQVIVFLQKNFRPS